MSSVYPASPKPARNGFIVTPRWNTIAAGMDGGNEQRDAKWEFPKYDVEIKYNPQDVTKMTVLWAFYMARKGSYEAFWLYDLLAQAHVGQYVGLGDGVTTIFDIPGASTSAHALYSMGVLQASGYSILTGGGDGNSDRVQFTVAPLEGTQITASFTGFLRMRVRFAEDKLSREYFERAFYGPGTIEFKGLAPA